MINLSQFKSASFFVFERSDLPSILDLNQALLRDRHVPIADSDPKDFSVGWSSHSSDTDEFIATADNCSVMVLRLIIETRDINAKVREKQVDKAVKILEKDGTILDDEQIAKIRNSIRLDMLAREVSHYSVVYVLIDRKLGTGMLSSTSKADVTLAMAALKKVADELHIHADRELGSAIGGQLRSWVRNGTIGSGLELSGSLSGQYEKCKIKLENADLTSEGLSDVLSFFEFSEASFSGFMKTDSGFSWRYVSGKIKANGDLSSLCWLVYDETLNECDDRADYEQALFEHYVTLWRQLYGQLVINTFGFDRDDSAHWLSAVADKIVHIEDKQLFIPGVDRDVYENVRLHVIANNAVSISNIQRKFKLSYDNAARMVELLELNGIVTTPDTLGVRRLLTVNLDTPGLKGGDDA